MEPASTRGAAAVLAALAALAPKGSWAANDASFRSLGIAVRMAGVVIHTTGIAMTIATGMTQRRSVRAP